MHYYASSYHLDVILLSPHNVMVPTIFLVELLLMENCGQFSCSFGHSSPVTLLRPTLVLSCHFIKIRMTSWRKAGTIVDC